MSDRIKSNDVIDDELFLKASQNSEAFMKNLVLVEAGLKAILVEAQKVMATTVFANSDNIEKYTEAVLKAAKAEEVLAKAQVVKEKALAEGIKKEQQAIKLQQEEEKLSQQSLKTKTALNKETERSEKIKLKEAKAQAAQTSEFKQATTALKALDQRMLDNVIAGREMSKTGKLVADAQKQLRDQIFLAEQSIGRYNRNVGNYTNENKKFSGSFSGLSNSVNQLTREFPAFTFSVQTGFLALSNNIPIFFDEVAKASKVLNQLKNEGQQVPSLFKTIASSVLSWGTALSVGVTLLTVYAKEIGEFTLSLFKMNNAFEVSEKTQSEYYTTVTELLEKRIDAQLRLNVLQGKMTEEEAELFDKNYEKRKKQLEIENNLLKERQEIADHYGVSLDKVNGKLPDITNVSGKEALKYSYDQLSENLRINDAYKNAQAKFNYEMKLLEQANNAEKSVISEEAQDKRDKEAEAARKKALQDAKKANQEQLEEYRAYELKYYLEVKKALAERQKFIDMWRESEENRDQLERDNNIVWWDKENGITLDDHNQTMKDIEATQKKSKEDKKKEREEEIAAARQQADALLSIYEQLNRARNERLEASLNYDIDARQRNIQQQQQLASQGLDNTLAFEKAALAKDELQRQQLARKKERDAKTLAFLKLVSSFADKGDNQAVMKAFVQMAIATAISGSFAEGVESLEGPGTETSDSILARLSKNESVVTAKGTRDNPGLPTAMNKGKVDEYFEKEYLPKYLISHDVGSFAENVVNSLMLQQFTELNSEIKDIKKALKERPVQQTDLTKVGDVVDTRIINGFKKITTHKNNSPLNYL